MLSTGRQCHPDTNLPSRHEPTRPESCPGNPDVRDTPSPQFTCRPECSILEHTARPSA